MTLGNTLFRLLTVLAATAAVAGCSHVTPVSRGDSDDFAVTMPPQPVPPEHNAGAIYQPASSQALFEDFKARRVGDVLTVVLSERTDASKSANTSTSKDASVDIANPTIAGRPVTRNGVPILDNRLSGSRSFDGSGDSSQSNRLDGSIAVTVSEVLPNGNLVVQGERWLAINQGKEYIRLRGIVRPVDIRANNTVLSTQVADAQLAYGGRGAVADSNRQGWASRFFNSGWWPF